MCVLNDVQKDEVRRHFESGCINTVGQPYDLRRYPANHVFHPEEYRSERTQHEWNGWARASAYYYAALREAAPESYMELTQGIGTGVDSLTTGAADQQCDSRDPEHPPPRENLGRSQSVETPAAYVGTPDGWIAVAIVGSQHTSVAFVSEKSARLACVKGEPYPFKRLGVLPVVADATPGTPVVAAAFTTTQTDPRSTNGSPRT